MLVVRRCESLARSLACQVPERGHGMTVRLQGSADWEDFWACLTARALQLKLASLRLDVNAPAIQEGYHACWYGPARGPDHEEPGLWLAAIPLAARGQPVGRLELSGWRDDKPVWEKVAALAILLERIEGVLHGPAAPSATTAGVLDAPLPGYELSTPGGRAGVRS
jgi:hypothetical protein